MELSTSGSVVGTSYPEVDDVKFTISLQNVSALCDFLLFLY